MTDILMPRLSDTMTEGTVASWRKAPGDPVAPGDVLVEIETDKALMEHEAYDAGTFAEILVPEGETAPIGAPIARVTTSNEANQPQEPPTRELGYDVSTEPTPSQQPAPAARPAAPERTAALERPAATPLVRRIARERGIDLAGVIGTGPGGRIIRADVDNPAPRPITPTSAPADTPGTARAVDADVVPFDGIRAVVAARLAQSTAVPTFTATASADVNELLQLRARINESEPKVSLNDLLIRATALALRAHAGVNASYSPDNGGQTLVHRQVHIGVAVASPAGLVVPVVRDADRLPVTQIAATTQVLIANAKDRKLTPADLGGGTFTISNLGMYGLDHFTAIIDPPQGAILAVGATRDELTLVDGEVTTRRRLTYTLTADHRIIDGALAAQFLATLTGLLESPLRILA